jgi:hypothetical protein
MLWKAARNLPDGVDAQTLVNLLGAVGTQRSDSLGEQDVGSGVRVNTERFQAPRCSGQARLKYTQPAFSL